MDKVAILPSSSEGKEGKKAEKNKNEDFNEWFRGFVDAEGYFTITSNRNAYTFTFGIGLHIDDLEVLKYIQKTLQIGTVFIKPKTAEFVVRRLDEVKIIIEIFSKTPLNSSKHLNFLSFKQAFELYTSEDIKDKTQLRVQIEAIKNSMNTNRTDYSWPNRKFHMTPNWLLGFIEGDGCFNIDFSRTQDSHANLRFRLLIIQSAVDLDLLLAIKNYINSLSVSLLNTFNQTIIIDFKNKEVEEGLQRNYVGMYSSINKKIVKLNEKYNLTVQNLDFIKETLLPFFDSLIFYTKKGLDYQDWKNILLLKEKGFHYTTEGLELIEWTLKQMNTRRLSTNVNSTVSDRELLLSKINELLNRPSNFESRDGKIYIKSSGKYYYNNTKPVRIAMLDGSNSVIKTWLTLTSCAEELGLSKSGTQKRLKNQTRFDFNGQIVYLKRSE
jgi:hypothetical protein